MLFGAQEVDQRQLLVVHTLISREVSWSSSVLWTLGETWIVAGQSGEEGVDRRWDGRAQGHGLVVNFAAEPQRRPRTGGMLSTGWW